MRMTAIVALSAIVATGCGSSDSDGTSKSGNNKADNSGSSERGITDDTIRLGVLASLTSPQGPPFPGFDDGARARIERANRDGGVNGRQIELAEVYDDGQDASTNLDQARAAAEKDDIFGLMVVSTAFLPQSSDYLADQNLPFTGWGFMPGFCGNDYGFGFNGCLVGSTEANTSLVEPIIDGLDLDADGLKWAIISGDDQIGRDSIEAVGFVAEEKGGEVVYGESAVPQEQPVTDYSPYVQDIIKADPDVAVLSINFGDAVPLAGGLKASGYKGKILTYSGYIPGLLESTPDVAAALDGTYVITQFPPQEGGSDATTQIEEDLEAIEVEPFISLGVASGYWSADAYIAMLDAAGEDLSAEGFAETINGGFEYESPLDGSVGAINYPRDHDLSVPCASLVTINGDAYEQILPVTCYENVEITG